MKVLAIGLLLFVATAFAARNNFARPGSQQKEIYLVDIENFNGESDILEYIFPEFDEDDEIDPSSRLWFAGWQARKELRKIQKQMPCGFPEYGIPPLAPYTNEELVFDQKKFFVDTITKLNRFRVDGLDQFEVKQFSVGVVFKTVKFHIDFPEIRLRTKFDTNTFIDFMKKIGVDVRFEGNGDIDFSLKHLTLKGSFKYQLPWFWGDAKIYKFNCVVTLRDCDSNIRLAALKDENLTKKLNQVIEESVLSAINDNQKEISDKIEDMVVPPVNEALKGTKVWDLFSNGVGDTGSNCVPPTDPWSN